MSSVAELAVVVLVCMSIVTESAAPPLWVSVRDGLDQAGCGTNATHACATIAFAVTIARNSPPDAAATDLYVRSGAYRFEQRVTITTPLALLAIDGPRTVEIDCGWETAAFLFDGIIPVSISGFVFRRGFGSPSGTIAIFRNYIPPSSGMAVTIADCDFFDSVGGCSNLGGAGAIHISNVDGDSNGPCVDACNAAIVISNCRFVNNTAPGATVVDGCGAQPMMSALAGAVAIDFQLSTPSGATLSNNAITVTNCSFIGNSVSRGGNRGAASTAVGGALAIGFDAGQGIIALFNVNNNNRFTITDSEFVDNSVTSTLPVESGNHAASAGGVVILLCAVSNGVNALNNNRDNQIVVKRSKFVTCSAPFAPSSVQVTAAGGLAIGFGFAFNSAGFNNHNNSILVTDSQFDSCVGPTLLVLRPAYTGWSVAAGAMAVLFVSQNSLGYDGTYGNWNNAVAMRRCAVTNNSGGNLQPSNYVSVNSGGVAIVYGAADGLYSPSDDNIGNSHLFDSCVFDGNSGGRDNTGPGTIDSSSVGAGALAIALAVRQFGARSNAGNSYAITNCTFRLNSGGSGNSPFDGAIGLGGAAVLLSHLKGGANNDVSFRSSRFISNQVTSSGGGAVTVSYLDGVATGNSHSIVDCSFTGNRASDGGGLLLYSSAVAVPANNVTTQIVGTQFVSNAVASRGSAVLSTVGGTVWLRSSSLIGNSGASASVYLSSLDRADVSGCLFDANFASVDVDHMIFEVNYGSVPLSIDSSVLRSVTVMPTDDADPRPLVRSQSPLHFSPSTQTECGFGVIPHHTPFLLGCSPCPVNQYLYRNGVTNGSVDPFCFPCAFGADCSRGRADVRSTLGFWASPPAESGELWFTACPDGYCCPRTSADGFCAVNDTCNGMRTGRLCGRCQSGFSESIGSTLCASDADCTAASRWAVPLALIIGIALAVYFVAVSAADARHDGLLNITAYWYQLNALFVVNAAAHPFQDGMARVFNYQFTGAFGGVCVLPGLTAISVQFVSMLAPLSVGVPILIVAAVMRYTVHRPSVLTRTKQCRNCLTSDDGSPSLVASSSFLSIPNDQPVLDLRQYIEVAVFSAGVKCGLLAYSTVLQSTSLLLHCVPVGGEPADSRFLFIAADTVCFEAWQYPVIVLFALLMCVPLAMTVGVWWIRRRLPSQSNSSAAVYSVLCSPYRDDSGGGDAVPITKYFELVFLFDRLVMICLSTFVVEPTQRLLSMIGVTLLVTLAHVFVRAFDSNRINSLQSLFLVLRVLVGVLSLPSTVNQSTAITDIPPAVRSIAAACSLVRDIVFAVPISVLIGIGVHSAYKKLYRRPSKSQSGSDLALPLIQ